MDAKSAKKMGVRFPLGSQHQGGRRGQNGIGNFDAQGKPVTSLSLANTIELIGFTSEESRRFPAENGDTFSGSLSYDKEGDLCYRMKMPLVKIPVRNAKDGGGAMPFTLGVEYGFTPPVNTNRGSGMQPQFPVGSGEGGGGSRGGSGGGRSGGGRSQGAGSSSGGSGSAQSIVPPVAFWIKNIKLATSK